MRFLESCPRCGYLERAPWRPCTFDWDIDIIALDDFPDKALLEKIPRGTKVSHIEGIWAYHKTQLKVERMLAAVWNARKQWRMPSNYYDHGPGHRPQGQRLAGAARKINAKNRPIKT
jgi:hypothetical protein